MSVSMKSLGTSQDEANRQIREFITTPNGTIEIYEPTVDDIADIIEIQRLESNESSEEVMEFDGNSVIKTLFPLLTNIDMTELDDDEIEDIIENPSVYLLTAQQVVAQIMLEVNKLYSQRIKTEITNAESALAQAELMNAIPSIIVNNARHKGEMSELTDSIAEAEKNLDEAISKYDEGIEDEGHNVSDTSDLSSSEVHEEVVLEEEENEVPGDSDESKEG